VQDLEARVGGLASAADLFAHALAVPQVTPSFKRVTPSPCRICRQMDYCLVMLGNSSLLELLHQRCRSGAVPCEQDDTRGSAI
jgi:hypothetical protein